MVCCCVPFCKSRSEQTTDVTYHQFPSDDYFRSKWLNIIFRKSGISYERTDSLLVCSIHFKEEDFISGQNTRSLKDDALPRIFLRYLGFKSVNQKSSKRKQMRLKWNPPRTAISSKNSKQTALNSVAQQTEFGAQTDEDKVNDEYVMLRSVTTQTTDELSRFSKYNQKKIAFQEELCRLSKQLVRTAQEYEDITLRLKYYEENQYHQLLKRLLGENSNGKVTTGAFLLDQIVNYPQEKAHWSSYTIRMCDAWLASSPKSYDFARKNIMKLPSGKTIAKLIDVDSGSSEDDDADEVMNEAEETNVLVEANVTSEEVYTIPSEVSNIPAEEANVISSVEASVVPSDEANVISSEEAVLYEETNIIQSEVANAPSVEVPSEELGAVLSEEATSMTIAEVSVVPFDETNNVHGSNDAEMISVLLPIECNDMETSSGETHATYILLTSAGDPSIVEGDSVQFLLQ